MKGNMNIIRRETEDVKNPKLKLTSSTGTCRYKNNLGQQHTVWDKRSDATEEKKSVETEQENHPT